MKLATLMALLLLSTQVTLASEKAATESVKAVGKRQLGTSFKFNGSTLRGKYQSSMGTAATVENDKLLEDLLKGRTQFEDRQEQEAERN